MQPFWLLVASMWDLTECSRDLNLAFAASSEYLMGSTPDLGKCWHLGYCFRFGLVSFYNTAKLHHLSVAFQNTALTSCSVLPEAICFALVLQHV